MYVGGGHPSLRSRLLLFLSCSEGAGWLWKRQGDGGLGISGSWGPEKETAGMTERAVGLSGLAQVPSLANLLALENISKC